MMVLATSSWGRYGLLHSSSIKLSFLQQAPVDAIYWSTQKSGVSTGISPSSHLSLKRKGRWGATDDFATSFLHFSLFSTALWDLANSRPVHSLMLSSYLSLCLPCLLPPFTVPCKMVLARPDERETWPYHCSCFSHSICFFVYLAKVIFYCANQGLVDQAKVSFLLIGTGGLP